MIIRIKVLLALFSIILTVIASFSIAQPDSPLGSCPALVEVALDAAASSCGDLARNQACYGHSLIEAEGREETVSFEFTEIGDVTDLQAIASMDLSPLSVDDEMWGVSILKVQANLPDTLPGQNVTFVLFGDTFIEDQAPVSIEAPFNTTQGVNVRLTPSQNGRLLGSLAANETITATGRYSDWVRIEYLYQRSQITGWVIADALTGDLSSLPEVDPNAPNLSPMQAFYFTTGIGEITCREAPLDGLLIQTPDGAGLMNFVANGVEISLGSTAFLQAVPGDHLAIHLLEGDGIVTANGVTQRLLPGSISEIPLDADGWAVGTPSFPVRSTECRAIVTVVEPIKLLPEEVSLAQGACVMPTVIPATTRPPNAAIFTPTPIGFNNVATIDPLVSPIWTPVISTITDTPMPVITATLQPCEGHPTDVGTLEVVNNAPNPPGITFKVVTLNPDCTLGATVVILGPGQMFSNPVPVNSHWNFYDEPNGNFYGNIYIAQAGQTYRFCHPNPCCC